jgi:excisionase family DNA binding protein
MNSHDQEAYDAARRLLTREQVAQELGVSPRTVARLVQRGELAYAPIGRLARFRPSDVAAFVERALKIDEDPARKPGPVTTPAVAGGGHGKDYSP